MKETHYFKGSKRIVITVADSNNYGGKGASAWPSFKLLLVLANLLAFIIWPLPMLSGFVALFGLWLLKKNCIIGMLFLAYLIFPPDEGIFAILIAFYYIWIWKFFKG